MLAGALVEAEFDADMLLADSWVTNDVSSELIAVNSCSIVCSCGVALDEVLLDDALVALDAELADVVLDAESIGGKPGGGPGGSPPAPCT